MGKIRTKEQIRNDLLSDYDDVEHLISCRPALENEEGLQDYIDEIYEEEKAEFEETETKTIQLNYKNEEELLLKLNNCLSFLWNNDIINMGDNFNKIEPKHFKTIEKILKNNL